MSDYYQRQVENIKKILNSLQIKKKSKLEIVELAGALGTQTMGTKETLVNNMAHKITSLLLEDSINSEKYNVEDYMQMPRFRTMAENSKEFFKLVIKNYKKQLKRVENKDVDPQPLIDPISTTTNLHKPFYSFNPTYQNYNFIPLVQNNINFNGTTSGYHVSPAQPSTHAVHPTPSISNMPLGYHQSVGYPDQLYSNNPYAYMNNYYAKTPGMPQFLPLNYSQTSHQQPQFPSQMPNSFDPRMLLSSNPALNPVMLQHLINKQTLQTQQTHQMQQQAQQTQLKNTEPPKQTATSSHQQVSSKSHTYPKQPAKQPPAPTIVPTPLPNLKPLINTPSVEFISGDSRCICNGDIEISQYSTRKLTCQNCKSLYHQECMKMKEADQSEKNNFECPSCTLRLMDPLHQVITVLKEDIINFDKLRDKTYLTHLKVDRYIDILKQQDKTVEIRCLKLDGINQYDISWPDCASLRINDEKPTEFKPLQYLSSVKKRKDNAVPIDNLLSLLTKKFNFNLSIKLEMKPVTKQLLKNYRIQEGYLYAIGIYIVNKLSVETLIKNITSAKIDIDDGKRLIIDNIAKSRDSQVEIQMLSISLNDPFNLERLKLPARGKYCEHPQCFSLDTFVLLMSHTPFPNWRCPICRRRCFNIKIDGYIQNILQQAARTGDQIVEVTFDIDGNYFFSKDKPCVEINDDEPCCKEQSIAKINKFD